MALWASTARADGNELQIAVRGFRSWPAAISSLQTDTHSEGRTLSVAVLHSDYTHATCDRYQLALDAVASAAFTVGACDPVTGNTDLILTRRTALFAHDDVVPEPLTAGITAVAVSTGGSAGGAAPHASSTLRCSVAVQPYLDDLEHGVRVPLTPGRFVLRPLGAAARVETGTNGWTLVALTTGSLTIEYDIFDTVRARVIAHDRASIHCANESLATSASDPTPHDEPPARDSTAPRERPLPSFTASFVGNLAGIGFVPLADVSFHHEATTATGRELQITAQWTYSASAGAMLDAPWFRGTVTLAPHVGEDFRGFQAVATAMFAIQIGAARIYAGPHYALSAFSITRVAGHDVDWTTEALSSLGVTGGIAFRSATDTVRGHASVADMHLELAVPAWGSGAVVVAFGFGWGGAL